MEEMDRKQQLKRHKYQVASFLGILSPLSPRNVGCNCFLSLFFSFEILVAGFLIGHWFKTFIFYLCFNILLLEVKETFKLTLLLCELISLFIFNFYDKSMRINTWPIIDCHLIIYICISNIIEKCQYFFYFLKFMGDSTETYVKKYAISEVPKVWGCAPLGGPCCLYEKHF